MAKRDPDAPTAEPNDVMANRIPACSPVEGCGSAERQPKLVITKGHGTMPTHAVSPRPHELSGLLPSNSSSQRSELLEGVFHYGEAMWLIRISGEGDSSV